MSNNIHTKEKQFMAEFVKKAMVKSEIISSCRIGVCSLCIISITKSYPTDIKYRVRLRTSSYTDSYIFDSYNKAFDEYNRIKDNLIN